MAYQNLPRFSPNYGNRYGFRPANAPSTGSANVPVPGSASAPPAPTNNTGSTSRPSEGYHSGPSAETIDGGNDNNNNAADVRDARHQQLGYERGQATPGQALTGFASVFGPPGLASLTDYAVGDLQGNVHPHEQYGAVGTIGTEGGVFGLDGREYDTITGRGLNSYSNKDAFYGSDYVQGIQDNPFSLDSYLSDPVNAYDYQTFNPNNPNSLSSQRGLEAQGFQFGIDRGAFAADEEIGTLPTQAERDALAQHVGQTEYNFEEHTVAPGTATNQAIQGVGYSPTGAATAGSQFSSTGVFSSGGDDNNDSDSGIGSDTFNDAGGSYVGDDPSGFDDGGDSGGGK